MSESSLNVLFHSKAKDLWECPQKYYWRYWQDLTPRSKNPNLERGGYVHKIMHEAYKAGKTDPSLTPDQSLAIGLVKAQEGVLLSSEDKEMADSMALYLWESLSHFSILHSEKRLDLELGDGFVWRAKLDSIIQEGSKLWQGEYKTTKQYASNIKRLYHTGIQPFLYLLAAKENGFELEGTKMFVATKKECTVEEVVATKDQLARAKQFMSDTLEYVQELHSKGKFPRNRCACVQLTSECPYQPLCVEGCRKGYIDETISLMYDRVDPLAHYEED
jgi:hypothetical protein